MEEKKQDDTVENKTAPRVSKMSMRLAALGISLVAVCAYAASSVIAQRATDPVLTYILINDISNQTYTPPAIGTGVGGTGGGGGTVLPPRPCGSPAVPHVAPTPHVSKVSYASHVSKVSYQASTASKHHVSKVSAQTSVVKVSAETSLPSQPALPPTDPC